MQGIGLIPDPDIKPKTLEAYYRKRHAIFHHTLAPSIDYEHAIWGGKFYSIKTNSLGFKDSLVRDITSRFAGKRILFLGDSFTEGLGIEYPDTFVGLIDKKLAAQNIQVLNGAASSYSPSIYLRKTEYLLDTAGLRFDGLVVFIDLSDMEDESKVYTFNNTGNVIVRDSFNKYYDRVKGKGIDKPQKQKSGVSKFIRQHTIVTAQLYHLIDLFTDKKPWKKSLGKRRAMWTLDDELYDSYGAKGLALAANHMTQLKTLLDKHHIPVTIVVYPWPDQIWHHDLQSRQVSFWQDWATKHNVELINLFPEFIKDKGDAEATIQKYFISGDVHWNRAGHQKVAQAILRLL